MIQRLALVVILLTATLAYALESDNRAEQARNVSSLTVAKVKIAAEQIAKDIYSGKVTRTFTPTEEPKAKGSPTPTVTPTATPTDTSTIQKVK